MATPSMIPYSNPAGNNQTSPAAGLSTGSTGPGIPTANPVLNPGMPIQSNPFVPISTGAVTGTTGAAAGTVPSATQTTSSSGATPNTSAANGFITNNSSYSSGENDLQKQLIDIYGKGVGGSLFSLLNNMSGTNSATLQEYIQSLAPQEATAQANLNTALGRSGISANSSVAALGDANLQAQEFADISGESANLTQSQENLTAQLLSGTAGAATKEVASSGWDVFSQVAQDVGAVAGAILA